MTLLLSYANTLCIGASKGRLPLVQAHVQKMSTPSGRKQEVRMKEMEVSRTRPLRLDAKAG